MGEMEGLDTHEPLPQRLERHAFDRLIMLSDGVFAIAITLAAIEIRPVGAWHDLATLWVSVRLSIFAYVISFVVIAAYWASHRDTFARLERADTPTTLLTLGMLCSVAVLPTTTRLIYEGAAQGAFQLYALSVATTGLFQSLLWIYASVRPGVMKREVSRTYRAGRIVVSLIVPAFFLAVAGLGGRQLTPVQLYLAAAMVVVLALSRRLLLPWMEHRRR